MAIRKIGSLSVVEKVTSENWRNFVVGASVRVEGTESKKLEIPTDDGFIYLRTRAVSAGEYHGANANGDFFPEEELKKSYKTFISRGVYLNHDSDDPRKAVGIVLDAIWHDTGKYVECLLAVDKSTDIAHNIEQGIADSTSMGCMVSECECSVCHKVAHTDLEYCDHLKSYMGKEYNGQKVYSINKGLNFYDESIVSVPADSSAKILERIASKQDSFEKMQKLATEYQAVSESIAAPEKPSEVKVDKAVDSKPPLLDQIVEEEVEKAIDRAITEKVRKKLQTEHVDKAVTVSDEELAGKVRQELSKQLPRLGEADNLHKRVAKLAEKVVEDVTKEKNSLDTIDLGNEYSIKVIVIREQSLAELYEKGEPTGIFVETLPETTAKEEAVKEYRKRFKLDSEIEKETPKPSKETQSSMNELQIRYRQGETLDKSYFIATRGNLQTVVKASQLLDKATQAVILAKEASKGTEISKEKTDSEHTLGKEKTQPSDLVPKDGKTEKETEKTDSTHSVGKDPIQPSDVVKKYADLAKGSILSLAKLWGSSITRNIPVSRTAKLSNSTENLAREQVKPEAAKGSMTDAKQHDDQMAREKVAPEAKPGNGSFGREVKQYFNGLQNTDHSTGGDAQWARKVASLNEQLKKSQAEVEQEKIKAELATKQLEAERKQAMEKEKSGLLSMIIQAEEAIGKIAALETDVVDLRDRGLSSEDANVKAYALAVDRERKRLASLDVKALEAIAETIVKLDIGGKVASFSKPANAPEIYREAGTESEENKLSRIW